MRKIAVVTGTRAEYGYLKPLMRAIEHDNQLELIPLVTGMHLLSEFGNTHGLVHQDFPKSISISMPLKGDELKDMTVYLSEGIKSFAELFDKQRPDVVVLLGDRSEPLAAALAALYLNIPIAHINGGDVTSGTLDESIRHCLTKIAHIHFVHTKTNAERVEKMGEEKKRIFLTGALTIDTILHTPLLSKDNIFGKYNLDEKKVTLLAVQHPITTIDDRGYSEIKILLEAFDLLKQQTVLLYPNCDAGGKRFISLIQQYKEKPYLHIIKNMPHEDYLSLLKSVDVMMGNSSSGIIEAPSFNIPVINIGTRQQGRERSNNILDVKAKKDSILKAVEIALHDDAFAIKVRNTTNKFGQGDAAQQIINVLKIIPLDEKLIKKQITY